MSRCSSMDSILSPSPATSLQHMENLNRSRILSIDFVGDGGEEPYKLLQQFLQNLKVNCFCWNTTCGNLPSNRNQLTAVRNAPTHGRCFITRSKVSVEGDVMVKDAISTGQQNDIGIVSLHHVGILCENLERSFEYYHNLLGFPVNEATPNDKLPYRGAWLWVGSEMIHLMELPNPDPLTGRLEHGERLYCNLGCV